MRRCRHAVAAVVGGVASLFTSALAAPPPITIQLKGGSVRDLAKVLESATSCHVMPMSAAPITLSVTNKPIWQVLSKLETAGLRARIEHGMISLTPHGFGHYPSWVTDWHGHGAWATALVPGRGGGLFLRSGAAKPHVRLWLLGFEPYTFDKVVIERATSKRRPFQVTTRAPTFPPQPCDPASIDLELDLPSTARRVSLRGYIQVHTQATAIRKVEIPFDDSVVDVAEGRLRVHVASRPGRQPGYRRVHVGWDNMGDPATVKVTIVDGAGKPVHANTRGSGSSGSAGHQDQGFQWITGKRYAILELPTAKGGNTEKIPFRFTNQSIVP